jgi:hypothetical protein
VSAADLVQLALEPCEVGCIVPSLQEHRGVAHREGGLMEL